METNRDQLGPSPTKAFFRAQPLPPGLQEIKGTAEGGRRQHLLVRLDQVTPELVDWLWPGRIAAGRLTALVGEPGAGKSFLALDLAARTSRGGPWPDCERPASQPASALVWSALHLAQTVRARLDLLSADLSRIVAVQSATMIAERSTTKSSANDALGGQWPPAPLGALDAAEIAGMIERTKDCKLVVIDPLELRVEPGHGLESSSSRLLSSLGEIASRRRVAIVAAVQVAGKSYGAALEHAARCLAAEPAVDALWHVARDITLDDGLCGQPRAARGRCAAVKHNAGPQPGNLVFELGKQGVVWCAAATCKAPMPEGARAPEAVMGPSSPRSALAKAADWLVRLLDEREIDSKELVALAEQAGISRATLRRAAAGLGLRPRKESPGGRWVWGPREKTQGAQYAQCSRGEGGKG